MSILLSYNASKSFRIAISVNDTVIEKIYSNPKNAELISYFWSEKAHKTIIGLNLITLYYSDINGNLVPTNYRIYDKKEGKTKNEYFREMVSEIINWGVKPKIVTGDIAVLIKIRGRSWASALLVSAVM